MTLTLLAGLPCMRLLEARQGTVDDAAPSKVRFVIASESAGSTNSPAAPEAPLALL